jgi:hypothetical protein
MSLIDDVLSRTEFADAPPVLVDVGASDGLRDIWKPIAKHSVCLAFDADDREMERTVGEAGAYKRLYVYHRVLVAGDASPVDFHLTRFPYCSSTLPPDSEKLSDWLFADLFRVEKTVPVQTTNLKAVLSDLKLAGVDWFKTDSQGTDLRLFVSLGEELVGRVLVAEFEPGIIDAYRGEDKLWQLMAYMDRRPFWMTDLAVKGSQNLRADLRPLFRSVEERVLSRAIRTSPGWGELCYMNSFTGSPTMRTLLLGWVFATVKEQHGFALRLAVDGASLHGDPTFQAMRNHTMSAIRSGYRRLLPRVSRNLPARIFRKLSRGGES